jgi:hypothetical protein
MNDEDWEMIEGFDEFELYEVSDAGNVRNLKTGNLLKQKIDGFGFCTVTLYIKGKRHKKSVHRLVANTFIDNPRNYLRIDHIDNDKLNNHFSNLRWAKIMYNDT